MGRQEASGGLPHPLFQLASLVMRLHGVLLAVCPMYLTKWAEMVHALLPSSVDSQSTDLIFPLRKMCACHVQWGLQALRGVMRPSKYLPSTNTGQRVPPEEYGTFITLLFQLKVNHHVVRTFVFPSLVQDNNHDIQKTLPSSDRGKPFSPH